MAKADPSQPLDGVAIVGMAGRFPGARNCDEFWENLRAGREGLTFFSDEELATAGFALGPHHEKRVRSRGVMGDAELFDAAFFGYSPKEAEIMDPQQRVFLEEAWTALENAGFDPDRVPGAVGVFAGASINTYYPTNVVSRPDILGPFGVFPAVVLNEKDFLATRVAYKLNLRGPAISVQTACSTSLVAVCNACQSLLSFECDLALAGGVAINFPHCHSHIHEEGGMISVDGHCRPFDKNATGTLFSDGVGVVALRRLEDAVAAGDTILAVIKGFALNNDGSDKPGFTAPSVNGQARVVQMAQAFGEVKPDSISYVEAHGTATPLGDPIEIAALTQAFRAGTGASQFCAIGSVKSNIGHLDVAAGIAGLIKTVLALQHRELPPTIHFTGPNPKIEFVSTPFFVVDRLLEWETPLGIPRRAGVSSFGIGGTNAHVVLEEAPKVSPSESSRPYQLLPLSARSQAAVDTATANLVGHLTAHPELPLADVAYTLQMGRHQFNHRRFVVCRDRAEALAQLGAERVKDHPALVPARYDPPVVFMFPGQGAQRVNMGRELYETEPLYRETVDACARALTTDLGLDLREVLFPLPDKLSWAEEQIVQTRITQPALFVTEYALARLWMAWGIRPAAMIGHSVGEYVAACLSGVFSLDDCLRVIAARGRLIQQQPRGTMLAVMAGEEEVRPLLGEGVSIAAVNAPGLCVASGSHDAMALLERVLADAGKVFRRLQTSHAFHSAMMEPVVAPFTELLQGVRLNRPQRPFVSNLTAAWITDGEATSPSYWAQHLRQAVRFADGVAVVLSKADRVLLEVGPGSTLTTLARQHHSKKSTQVVVPSLPSGRDQLSDIAGVLGAMGRLWQAGIEIDWAGFHSKESRRRVPLPSYPFERKRFFVEPGRAECGAATAEKRSDPCVPVDEPQLQATAMAASHRERILARLYRRLQALSGLSVDELGAGTTFIEMGFDSLFLAQVCRALEVEFGVPITLRQLAEDLSSTSRLADYLEAALAEENDKRPKGNTIRVAGPTEIRKAGPIVREARFDEKDLAGILVVLRQAFPAPYGACSLADFIREQNRNWLDNPARTPDHVFGWVLEGSTEGIVGFLALLPVRIKIAEREIVGGSGCSLAVLPAYRNYSLLLSKQLMDWGDRHFCITTTANVISSKLNKALGMNEIPVKDFSQKLIWLLRPEAAVKRAISQSRWKALQGLTEQFSGAYLLKGIARLWFIRHRRLRFNCPKLSIEPVVSFTEEFNDLWENNKKDYDITTVRNRAFLNWRHCGVASLLGRTFVFACRDGGQILGYIALQARSHESGYLRGHYVVTDLFYERTRKDVLYNLMNYAFEFAKAQGCSIFQVAGYSNEVVEELKTQRPYIRRDKSCPYWYTSLTDVEAKLCEEKRWWPSGADGDSNL